MSSCHSWGTAYVASARPKSFLASAAACSHGAKEGCGPPGTSASLTSAATAAPITPEIAAAANAAVIRFFNISFLPKDVLATVDPTYGVRHRPAYPTGSATGV